MSTRLALQLAALYSTRPTKLWAMLTGTADTADKAGAFIEQFTLTGAAAGPLSGLTVAVKDMFDVSGAARAM